MATAKQIAQRAWQIGPTWMDAVGLTIAGVLLVWWLGVPWLIAVLACALAGVAIFGLLGWLDLLNEAADAEEQAESPAADGTD